MAAVNMAARAAWPLLLCVLLALGARGAWGATSPIKRVVTLMMENHSFDNMLGWLPGIGSLTGERRAHAPSRARPLTWARQARSSTF
jgi:phospholipase C